MGERNGGVILFEQDENGVMVRLEQYVANTRLLAERPSLFIDDRQETAYSARS